MLFLKSITLVVAEGGSSSDLAAGAGRGRGGTCHLKNTTTPTITQRGVSYAGPFATDRTHTTKKICHPPGVSRKGGNSGARAIGA